MDLNRNFPCGFGLSKDINKHNPGKSAGDQPETKHLMTFVSQLSTPLGVIHYHSQGSLIYYDYDVTGSLRNHIVKMASIAHATTGYPLIEAHGKNAGSTLPGGGFGDWCVYEKKIPFSRRFRIGSTKVSMIKIYFCFTIFSPVFCKSLSISR